MSETMGQIIRRLRKERNLTQEELAEQLNVTFQAVSRWENGTGMPDISQVVPLANVFGVTTDVLFGRHDADVEDEVQRIIKEASAPTRFDYETEEEGFQVYVKEYETYIRALKTYPNSVPLLYISLASGYNLSWYYIERGDNEKADELRRECIRQGNLILKTCTDITRLMETHRWLVMTYGAMGDFEKAEEHANQMPQGYDTEQGRMIADIKWRSGDTDGEIEQHCCNIAEILNLIESEIIMLGNAYYRKEQYEDAVRVYKTVYSLLPIIYGNEEYTPPYHILNIGGFLALCYVKLGQYDEAMEWLWKDFYHISRNARYYNKRERIETPLLRGRTFSFFGESVNVKDHMILNRSEFEVLHNHPRWKELIERIEES